LKAKLRRNLRLRDFFDGLGRPQFLRPASFTLSEIQKGSAERKDFITSAAS
jgi:hypothetical protein